MMPRSTKSSNFSKLNADKIVRSVLDFYNASRDANGLPVRYFVESGTPLARLVGLIKTLVEGERIEVVFAETDDNPHIRRIPQSMRKPFQDLLPQCDITNACLYPGKMEKSNIDPSNFEGGPFTKRLWLGDSSLELEFFSLDVLERYRNDPRYIFEMHSVGGSIYTSEPFFDDPNFTDQHAFIQTFGIGYDSQDHHVLCVPLCDLTKLSASHQVIWERYRISKSCRLNDISFQAWIFGGWPDKYPIYDALLEEMRIINKQCKAGLGRCLFKDEFSSTPNGYGVLLRPTEKEFLNFADVLDKMLSENIDPNFFVSPVRQPPVGTIGLLKEWLLTTLTVTANEHPAIGIARSFNKVRKARSKRSHQLVQDVFDYQYQERQRELIMTAYGGIRTLRLVFQNLPGAENVSVPKELKDGRIVIP